MTVLGAHLRAIAAGIYVGATAGYDVHASRGPRGWRVCAVEPGTGSAVAFGVGETLDAATRAATLDFAVRMRAA